MRNLPLVLVVVALTACNVTPAVQPPPAPRQPAAPVSDEPDGWEIVDVMPTWWDYWDNARELPREEQLAMFQSDVVARHPMLFTREVIGRDPTKPFDLHAQVERFLQNVGPLLPAMAQISDSIAKELPRHRATFEEAFPGFTWNGKVYFTISLDAFDGAIRNVESEPTLLFGVDKIARLHGDEADLAPLFHHELFHVLHLILGAPFAGSPENQMYQALWGEGLAVLVAKRLNPSATARQLVLDDDMVTRGEAQLAQLAQEMLDNIDSSDPTFYRDWFRGSGQRKDIPVRVGYYLGLRVAEVVGRGRSLQELARLTDPALRDAIETALRELAGQ